MLIAKLKIHHAYNRQLHPAEDFNDLLTCREFNRLAGSLELRDEHGKYITLREGDIPVAISITSDDHDWCTDGLPAKLREYDYVYSAKEEKTDNWLSKTIRKLCMLNRWYREHVVKRGVHTKRSAGKFVRILPLRILQGLKEGQSIGIFIRGNMIALQAGQPYKVLQATFTEKTSKHLHLEQPNKTFDEVLDAGDRYRKFVK